MSGANAFGSIFIARAIEESVEALILDRLDMYLAEVQRLRSYSEEFPHIEAGNVTTASDPDDAKPGNHFPQIIVTAPGTVGDPVRHGDGTYSAKWGFGIACWVESVNQAEARANAECYAAALRALVLQNKSLNGISSDTKWLGEAYDETPVETSRTIGVALIRFETAIDVVVDALTIPNAENEPVGHPDHHDDPGDYDTVLTPGLDIDTY